MSARPWTDDEIGFIEEHEGWTAPRIAEEIGRTVGAVRLARHKLRHGKPIGPTERFPWTETEDAVLLDTSDRRTSEEVAESLPGRSPESIRIRRRQLGVVALTAPGQRPFDIGTRPLVARTCHDCGLLLAGSWFYFNKRPGKANQWSARCRRCSSAFASYRKKEDPKRRDELNRAHLAKMQSITAERATRNRESYTEADYAVLADQSLTDFQKALRLGRTFLGVKSARQNAGLKSKPDGLGDPERDVWIIDNPNVEQVSA